MMLKTPLDSIDWCAWFGGGWVGCMMWKVWKLYQGHSDFAPSTNLPVLTASAVLLLPVLLSACVLQEVLFRAAAWTALTRAGYWLPARMLGPKYQIPHLQVAPNLPSGVTKKVHNMPTSKSITILSDNHWKLDPRYDIAFQMPRGRGEMFVVELSSHVINACPTAEIVRGVWTYLIFVTGATGGARVNFFGRCKFFSDVTQKIGNLLFNLS